jgi:hypothetical protein
VLNVLYDPEERSTEEYGFWECPECQNTFFGGGTALHKKSCSRKGYDSLIYHFGAEEIRAQKEREAEGYGEGNSPVGFRESVKSKYPELWNIESLDSETVDSSFV